MFRCIWFHWWHIMIRFESTCKGGGSSVTASCSCFSFNIWHFIVWHFQPFVNIYHHCLIHHYDVNWMPPDVTCTDYILHLCCQNQPNTFSISEQSDALFYLMVCKGFQVDFKYSWAFMKQGLAISVCVVKFRYLSGKGYKGYIHPNLWNVRLCSLHVFSLESHKGVKHCADVSVLLVWQVSCKKCGLCQADWNQKKFFHGLSPSLYAHWADLLLIQCSCSLAKWGICCRNINS